MSDREYGRRRPADQLVLAVFVASGAAGLMYEVVWSRELVLVFGNTTQAIGTIVSAFMAGLGLGGLAGGLLARRLRRPLLVYGLVELAVGSAALLVPLGFQAITGVYSSAYGSASSQQLTVVRLALTMAVVTPVTFLMGLTLPLLTRHLIDSMRVAGRRLGQLYAANTLGAAVGTLVSGLLLIELVGLSATARIGVGLNLLVGAVAVVLGARGRIDGQVPDLTRLEMGEERLKAVPGLPPLLYAATFVSGFVALGLEVLWTRLLAEGTGSHIYNFVLILAVYLLGIALGGAIYRAVSRPWLDTPVALALALLVVAVGAVATVPLGTLWLGPTHLERTVMLLPATAGMGYAFPLSARLLTRDPGQAARSVGMLYGWNTAGSIGGSLMATFVLAGTLGTNASILALAAANAAIGLLLAIFSRRPLAVPSLGTSTIAAAQVAVVLCSSLLIANGSPWLKTATEHLLDAHHQPYNHVEDDLSTLDAVGGAPSNRKLYLSGTAMTTLSVDTKLMAYLPKVLRPRASSFLDIAFGMGTTYRSAINLGMHTDAVDLSASVPRQMPHFYPDAGRYLHSPLGRIIIGDGRNYVRLASRQYDVVSVDPPPPIQAAGAVVLYSREFYADAHRRLKAGGVMLEWLYFGVTLDELREHLRTFRSQFMHVDVLLSPMQGGIYMVGSDATLGWDAATASRILGSPQATQDIRGAPDYPRLPGGSWPEILDGMRWLRDGQVDRFAGSGPLITDDRPRTEYYLLQQAFLGDRSHVTARQLRHLAPAAPAHG